MANMIFILIAIVICAGWTNPSFAQSSFLDKAVSEYKQENYEEALELLLKAKDEGVKTAAIVYYLGSIYKNTGNNSEAVIYLKEAISLDPNMHAAYAELIEALYNSDRLKEAEEYIAEAERRGIATGLIVMLKGSVLAAEGDTAGAIKAYRHAAQLDKSLAQTAELYIAVVYAYQKKYKESLDILKAVSAAGAPADIAEFAKDYEKQITEFLQSHKTWAFSADIRYQYDDNLILKPSTPIPDFVITGEKDSSIIEAFKIDYTPLIAEPLFFSAHLYLFNNTYSKNEFYNYNGGSITIMPGYNFRRSVLTMPISYSHVWLEGNEYMGILSLHPTYNILLADGHIGQVGVGYTNREMLNTPFNSDEDRDGKLYSASAGYFYTFSNNKGILGIRYEFTRDSAAGINWSNNGNRITLSAIIPISSRIELALTGDAFLQNYKNIHTFFDIKRKDKTYSASCNISFELIKNLNIYAKYKHTKADSNIAVYDYKRNIYSFGIEYKF